MYFIVPLFYIHTTKPSQQFHTTHSQHPIQIHEDHTQYQFYSTADSEAEGNDPDTPGIGPEHGDLTHEEQNE